jgi:hypothetical protein
LTQEKVVLGDRPQNVCVKTNLVFLGQNLFFIGLTSVELPMAFKEWI